MLQGREVRGARQTFLEVLCDEPPVDIGHARIDIVISHQASGQDVLRRCFRAKAAVHRAQSGDLGATELATLDVLLDLGGMGAVELTARKPREPLRMKGATAAHCGALPRISRVGRAEDFAASLHVNRHL